MPDAGDEAITISHGNKLEDLFPGYYPPTKNERLYAYQHGLVSLDANALLDLYRFSEAARNEFFEVLEKIRQRLYVTHQAALEFYRNRLSVVASRLNAAEEQCKEIEKPVNGVIEKIQEFANRYRIDPNERQRLIGLVESLSSTLTDSIKVAGTYDLTMEHVRGGTDVVLTRLQSLLADRVGDALSEAENRQAIKDALRRKEERIPPGYADVKAPPERQAGDYLVWRELMNEALVHDRPVLFVTNENKEDWVLMGPSNQVIGPRPELVLEMRREAKVALHMVTVVGLLTEAPEYLGMTVSPSTIREAESLPDRRRVILEFRPIARQQFGALSEAEQDQMYFALDRVGDRLKEGLTLEDWSEVSIDRKGRNSYLLRWSSDGRAIFRIEIDISARSDIVLLILQVSKKRSAAESVVTD